MDGYETLAAIKSDESLRHLPVIMISARRRAGQRRSLPRDGRGRLPAQAVQPGDPRRARSGLARGQAAARRGGRTRRGARQSCSRRSIARSRSSSRFLSPQVAALISSPEGEQLLAGHRRETTSVFCDLRGFTTFSDSAEPEELLGVLREYHSAMGSTHRQIRGTLEHFAGDGMMVFFNDPVLQSDHVERAVNMSIDMRDAFATLAARWSKLGFDLGLGIGIATGYATLGRIGFEGRYDYGTVGTAVIVASRLGSAAAANQILLNPRATRPRTRTGRCRRGR